MKQIPKEVNGRDFWIVLLKHIRGKQPQYNAEYGLALYLNKSDGYFAGFEVHIVRRKPRKRCIIKVKDGSVREFTSPEQEHVARSEDFGVYAWAFPDLETVYRNYPIFRRFDCEIRKKLSSVTIRRLTELFAFQNIIQDEIRAREQKQELELFGMNGG